MSYVGIDKGVELELYIPYWVTKSIDLNKNLLLFNWHTNNHVSIYDINHPAYCLRDVATIEFDESTISNQDFIEDIEWLLAEGFLITKENKNLSLKEPNVFMEDVLHLIILPAGEACNLDCVYCYENHDDTSLMKASHADALVQAVQKYGKKRLSIEYFGGEPLLNIKFIEYFSRKLQQQNIDFVASVTTNGTLITEEVLEILYQAKVRSFQITLDGPKSQHNNLRRSKSKNLDSFELVCNALRLIARSNYSDVNVILRMNVNHDSVEQANFGEMADVIESIIPKDDNRFVLLPKLISDYASANQTEKKEAELIYCKSNAAKDVVQKFETYIYHNYISADALLITKRGGYSCYAGNPNSFVITPDFVLRKCTVAFNDSINTVGRLSANGDFVLNDNFNLWVKDFSDDYCDKCFVQNSCHGNSCPLENISKGKKTCPPVKMDIPELTRKVAKTYEKIANQY